MSFGIIAIACQIGKTGISLTEAQGESMIWWISWGDDAKFGLRKRAVVCRENRSKGCVDWWEGRQEQNRLNNNNAGMNVPA